MSALPVIGIDLGTTYSCVGCLKNDRIEIIANSLGKRTTPSIVAYTANPSEVLVGINAAYQMPGNSANTFYNSKRVIGKIFGDPTISSDIEKFPFKVIKEPSNEQSGKAVFAITNGHKFTQCHNKSWVSPEEVAAEVLKTLKSSAESYIGTKVRHAVITVPAYFNNEQRKATRKAGELAGLNVLKLLNEPTAAALAYGEHGDGQSKSLDTDHNTPKTILVFDLGGGTLDVSLLKFTKGDYNVIATFGDNHLGGEDFTNTMIDHFLKKFANQINISVTELSCNRKILRKLRSHCEEVKLVLSSSQKANIYVENLYGERELNSSMDRKKFEEINQSLFDRLTKPLDKVLKISDIDKSQVDDIVLAGGATRMPKVREILHDYFGKDVLKETINPDEAVSFGATIMAIKLAKDRIEELDDEVIQKQLRYMIQNNKALHSSISLHEIIPMSISTDILCKRVSVIIPRNTPIPTSITNSFPTSRNNQITMDFEFYEGESLLTEKNNLLGSFIVTNLTPRLRGQTEVSATVSVDLDGIMKISAHEIEKMPATGSVAMGEILQSEKKIKELVIEDISNTLTMEQRINMIQNHKDTEAEDAKEYQRRCSLSDLIFAIDDVLHTAKKLETKQLTKQEKAALGKLKNMSSLYDNDSEATEEEILSEKKYVDDWQQIFSSKVSNGFTTNIIPTSTAGYSGNARRKSKKNKRFYFF